MDIKPIRSERDYEAALHEIEALFDAPAGRTEADRLDILTTLVEVYESHHYPMPQADPVEMLKYYMESRGLTRADIEPFIGSRARVAEILNRKRPLTLEMIRRLYAGLGIPAEVLVQPYAIRENKAEYNTDTES